MLQRDVVDWTMQVCGRFLRMYRLCGGGGVAGGGSKPPMGMFFRYGPPLTLRPQTGHAPSHGAPTPSRRKTWTFIQDSLSYDTFFTMKRLIERSQRPDEVLRWISQNPTKISHNHYAVALQRIAQLLQAPSSCSIQALPSFSEATPAAEGGRAKADIRKLTLEHEDFLSLCDAIVRDCSKFDNFSVVNCLYAVAALGLPPESSLVRVLEAESHSRLSQFNQKDVSMVFSSSMRLHHHNQAQKQTPGQNPGQKQAPDQNQAQIQTPGHNQAQIQTPGQNQAQIRTPGQNQDQTLAQNHAQDQTLGQNQDQTLGQNQDQVGAENGGQALTEACVSGLERSLERERHPQTLFLLLTYYRRRWRELQSQSEEAGTDTPTAAAKPELLLTNRKILRLVKHTLSCVSAVRDQEMVLLDEMLAACAAEASNKSLELIFSSHLFHQNRQERFIGSLAEELPKKVDSITPHTMALIAKYIARHRLRDTRLLDTIAEYLVKKAEYLDSKVIQRLVFPFSRMNYRPSNEVQFFCHLEEALELKALTSPLATVNILMSLFQLQHFPQRVLSRVFCSSFISNLTNSPYVVIVRRYLSLLDAAVELEFRDYTGPRLNQSHKVLMFDHALTADEANRKYSYKGLVAEALRQLVGEQNYKQDQILAPGYYTDFLLWIDSSRRVLPIRSSTKPCDPSVAMGWQLDSSGLASDFQKFSPFSPPPSAATAALEAGTTDEALPVAGEALPAGGGAFLHHMTPFYGADYYTAPNKDQDIHRLVLSVNDKWHYCHNSQVLVGSRAMRDRHLRLLGYLILQLPYHELEKLNGIEEVKQYLHQKLLDVPL